MQRAIGHPQFIQVPHRVLEIGDVGPVRADAPQDLFGDLIGLQSPIGFVAAIDDERRGRDDRRRPWLRGPRRRHLHRRTGGRQQRRLEPARLIDAGEHLALMQIVADGFALGAADLVGAAAAGAAAIEPEHQAGLLLGAAVVRRFHAERAVIAAHQGRVAFEERKARIPHQRAVGEDPEILARRRRQAAALDEVALAHRRATRATPTTVTAMPRSASGPSVSPNSSQLPRAAVGGTR